VITITIGTNEKLDDAVLLICMVNLSLMIMKIVVILKKVRMKITTSANESPIKGRARITAIAESS
jgi:hypothetical protein